MRTPYVHPFLATAFPILFLYARNTYTVAWADVWSSLAVALLATGLAQLALWRLARDAHKRSLVLTLAVFLFYSYGHFVRLAPRATRQRLGVSPETIAAVAGVLVIFGLAVWFFRARRPLGRASAVANVITAALVGVQLTTLAFAAVTAAPVQRPVVPSSVRNAASGARPDIYFILLDGYARSDVLREIYAYDNGAFLDSLRALDFRVLERSRANYCQTILSLAATLNLDYVSNLIEIDPLSRDRRPAHRLIRDNRLFAELRSLGYSIVSFSSGFEATELASVDHFLRPGRGLSEFQQIVVSTTPVAVLMRLGSSQYDLHRERIDFILRTLPNVSVGESPRFVFAHLVSPHPPFVFGATGEPMARSRSFDFADGSDYYDMGGSPEEYIDGYRDQVAYVSSRILTAVGEILGNATQPPVIILQSDHGPGSQLNWWSLPRTDLPERFGILNAILLPDAMRPVPADLSPVNTFRFILREHLGSEAVLLPNRSYFTVLAQPYYYFDVTGPETVPAWPGDLEQTPLWRQTTQ